MRWVETLKNLQIRIFAEAENEKPLFEEDYFSMAHHLADQQADASYCQKVFQANSPEDSTEVEKKRTAFGKVQGFCFQE